MAETIQVSDSQRYFKDNKDEHRSQPYVAEEVERQTAGRLRIEAKGGARSEAYLIALLQALGTTFETENLVKQADVLIRELKIQPDEFVYRALVHFVQKYEDEMLTKAYNEAYDGEMEEEEVEMLRHVRAYHAGRLSAE
jgi:hypothetical protein